MNKDKKEIEKIADILEVYGKTISQSDLESLVNLYAEDAVLLPQYGLASVGVPAIRKAYQVAFATFKLNVVFIVDEIRQVAPEWIFARSHSTGTVILNVNGQNGPVIANQELWIFQNVNRAWKIARYCFTTTNPPRV